MMTKQSGDGIQRWASIVILVVVLACTGKPSPSTEARDTKDGDFMEYVSLLPQLQLPLDVNCETCCPRAAVDDDHPLVQQFKPEGSSLVGLIDKTPDHVIILTMYPADIMVPVVTVYNPEGTLLAKMDFLTSYCGGDVDLYSKNRLTITRDMHFVQTDTTYYFEVDSAQQQVLDTTEIDIARKVWAIDKKGQFMEQKSADIQ